MKTKTPKNSPVAVLYDAAKEIIDGTRKVFEQHGQDARELRLPRAAGADREDFAMTPKHYCAKCNAPRQWPAYFMRCGPCAVINGKLPPTKYQPLKEKT